MNAIQTINFHNQPLVTLQQYGIAYVAMKPICENIGLDWEAQRQRISRDEVLNSVACMIKATSTDSKIYKMLCLPIHYLNGWLFGVDVNRVKPQIKDKLITYKKECYQALFDYWSNGIAINARQENHPTTKDQREPLRNAVNRLVSKTNLIYGEAYKLIHEYMGVEHIDQIPLQDLSKAIQYAHSLALQANNEPLPHPVSSGMMSAEEYKEYIHNHQVFAVSLMKKGARRYTKLIRTIEQLKELSYQHNLHIRALSQELIALSENSRTITQAINDISTGNGAIADGLTESLIYLHVPQEIMEQARLKE